MAFTLHIMGFPAFILLAFATSGKSHAGSFQVMFSAKLSQIMHFTLDAIWRYNDIVSYLRWRMSKCCNTLLFTSCRIAFLAYSRCCCIAFMLLSLLSTKHSLSLPLNLFRCRLPANTCTRSTKLGSPTLFTAGLRDNTTKTRTGNTVKIKALLAKRFELVKPVLLSCGQGHGQDEFQDFEGESIGSVLIPCCKQLRVMVLVALKMAEMSVAALIKVHGAANIDFSGNNTGDAVNARCGGDILMVEWGHSYGPPTQVYSLEARPCFEQGRALLYSGLHYTTSSRLLSNFMSELHYR